MQLFEEVDKIYEDILADYEKEAIKIKNDKFVASVKNLLFQRNLKYEVIAKQLEIQLLSNDNQDKLFERTYKQLDKISKSVAKDLKRYIPRQEKRFKISLLIMLSEEHEKFLNCFKKFESEVKNK